MATQRPTISYAENGIAAVTTVTATDADAGQSLSYSIGGGADAGLFNINRDDRRPDVHHLARLRGPADAGLNNVYDVIVQGDR